jgi:hypothetical protein
MIRAALLALAVLAVSGVAPVAARADGDRYGVIVQGASGEAEYATLHRGWVDSLAAVMRDRFKFDPAHLFLLTETPRAGEQRGTAENVRAVLGELAKRAKPDDLVFVMLIGHGGGDGAAAKFNMVGPDLTPADWKALLDPIVARTVVVDSTSSSFPFLAGLAAPNRIVVTATSSYAQRYHTYFPEAFIASLTDPAADADKNGRISLLEAFVNASRLVALHFEQSQHLATERAVLDDTGDGVGRDATTAGSDGVVAGLTYLDVVETPTVSDPELQRLLVRQRELSDQVDALRRRRPSMTPEAFDQEFETLIIELALVSRDVRRRSGG